jgi:hypothetical protein
MTHGIYDLTTQPYYFRHGFCREYFYHLTKVYAGKYQMYPARLIMYHKQSTSARTRFLMLPYGGVCAFDGLPKEAQLLRGGQGSTEKVAFHPGAMAGEAVRKLCIPSGSLEIVGTFRAKVDVSDRCLNIFLARFTSIDPPFASVEINGAKFIDITQIGRLSPVELLLLRQAYEEILG